MWKNNLKKNTIRVCPFPTNATTFGHLFEKANMAALASSLQPAFNKPILIFYWTIITVSQN
jgi:hypothetical protein